MPTHYDAYPYPGFAYAQSHPDRLATLGALFGMSVAEVERCRVLELGCGDGGNLIPMAYGLPGSRFVGVDSATSAIDRGKRLAATLDLGNVELVCADIAEIAAAGAVSGSRTVAAMRGEFDFIIAHGVYSWVSAAARDSLLEVCRSKLAPNGVAYVSYNAMPGAHLRLMVREMMLFDGRESDDPQERVDRARSFLYQLADAGSGDAGYRQLLAEQLARVRMQSDAEVMHDDLEAVNQPVYFHEFAGHAAAHGLQFLAEADFFEMAVAVSSPDLLAVLNQHLDDVAAREQYLDFLTGRMYRQSLLCHAELKLERHVRAEVIPRLLIASAAESTTADPTPWERSPVEFRGPQGMVMRTEEPLVKVALRVLNDNWPRRMSFERLLDDVRSRLAVEASPRADDASVLAESLLKLYAGGVVDLHVHEPPLSATAGERPRATGLARVQAAGGEPLTTLRHTTLRLDDREDRLLVTLLDGTRDRAALIRSLSRESRRGRDFTGELEEALAKLARLALLER